MRVAFAVIAIVACKKESPIDAWAKRPMATVTGSTCLTDAPMPKRCSPPEGVRFSVSLPEGLERNATTSEVGIGGHYGQEGHNEPLVTIEQCDVPASREAWKKSYANFIYASIDRDEQLPNGFLVASRERDYADSSVTAVHVKGELALCCHAFFVDHDHAVADAARTTLQTICRSVAFR